MLYAWDSLPNVIEHPPRPVAQIDQTDSSGSDASACSASSFASVVKKYPWPEGYLPLCAVQDFDVWESLLWGSEIEKLFRLEEEDVHVSLEKALSRRNGETRDLSLFYQPSRLLLRELLRRVIFSLSIGLLGRIP